MNVESEICRKLKLDAYNPQYNRQDYLRQLILAVDSLPHTSWNSLSRTAQDWANDAAAAYKANVALPEPDIHQILLDAVKHTEREVCAALLEPLLTKDTVSKEDITSIIDKLLSHKKTKIS